MKALTPALCVLRVDAVIQGVEGKLQALMFTSYFLAFIFFSFFFPAPSSGRKKVVLSSWDILSTLDCMLEVGTQGKDGFAAE